MGLQEIEMKIVAPEEFHTGVVPRSDSRVCRLAPTLPIIIAVSPAAPAPTIPASDKPSDKPSDETLTTDAPCP